MLAFMNPEHENPKPTQELTPRTPGDILPPSLKKYTPGVEDYMRIAAKQKVNQDIKTALVTYALYVYGTFILKSDGQRARQLISPEEISEILNIPEDDVKKHMLLIETIEGIKAWEHFETDIKELNRQLRKQQGLQARKLREKGLAGPQIAKQLGLRLLQVERYLKQSPEE